MPNARYSSREMIARLVGFDTTSRDSNLALIDFAEDYLTSYGATTRRTYDDEGRKANLFATIGPDEAGGVVLSGHTDVVPVDGQDWHSNPFEVVEKDGLLYGRGTADMKSFLAIAMAALPDLVAKPVKRPIHLALSYDEEVGCNGVGRLLQDIKENLPMPEVAIIGEPSDMQIVHAHKGVHGFEVKIKGKAAHSSQPHRGASAIIAAGKIIAFIEQLALSKRAEARPESGFEPPYTSFQIGRIEGGTALNIIPEDCTFIGEFRAVPWEDEDGIIAAIRRYIDEEALPTLREFTPDADIEFTDRAKVPPLAPEEDGPAEAFVRQLTGANAVGVVSYATEGGLFQEAGISAVICGPGSIDQAHQPNEFIALSQVEQCERFMARLWDWAGQEKA